MRQLICKNCGYTKNRDRFINHILTTPVYPFYNATIIAPELASTYILSETDSCPYCGKNSMWMTI